MFVMRLSYFKIPGNLKPMGFRYPYKGVRCPKVTVSNRIGHHVSRGHITRESNLLLQFVGATNPSSSITWLVHGLSWIGLAAPTIPWLRAMVSSLLAILDTRRWGMAGLTVKLRDGDRYAFCVKYMSLLLNKYGNGLHKAGRYRVGIREDSCLPVSQYACLCHSHLSLVGWLYDMESIFRIFHIEAHLQVLLATRCLAVEARLWWMTIGEPSMPGGTWVDFCALITVRYGLPPDEDANMPYRDPEIYNDMYLERFISYVADWRTYPNESMGHYYQRFRDAMLPHIPHALGSPLLQALFLLREGLPPNVRPFVPEPLVGMTLEGMIEAIMEAEIIVHGMQATAPEEDQVVPVYDTGIAEAGAEDDVMDPTDFPADPEDHPEDPPVIIIESDDEEEDEEDQEQWEEQEGAIEEDFDDLEGPEEDSKEILFDHADWDADSDISSDRSIT
ncbi:hypothetical protein TIFTF001_040830 [Ficus carica]|uniref:Uncharacterized protein n=1 Tax=Ficus carica TaxID=3494 RepID=A0AA87Z5Y0_FICCA|nr:hypothetical protein TIFTF001_040830 [Ficus carica]